MLSGDVVTMLAIVNCCMGTVLHRVQKLLAEVYTFIVDKEVPDFKV
jgi:hypothetical protein